MIDAIVTIAPYAPFIEEVVAHPLVSGLRLNTVMPIKAGTLDDVVKRLRNQVEKKDLWIDLKCRQLRVKTFGVPPFTEIELTHKIKVDTPVTAYFSDGKEYATVLEVDGNKLIMQDGPKRVIGPGESVNIPHPSLRVEGYFTDTDTKYVEAGLKAGVHTYMLSFVEQPTDAKALYELDPAAHLAHKIESRRGIKYALKHWDGKGRLMSARGDLYVELAEEKPHLIIKAMESLVQRDPGAIAASRILPSLAQGYMPSCTDLGDVDSLIRMGYKTLMLGDDVCQKRDSVMSALNLLGEMVQEYK